MPGIWRRSFNAWLALLLGATPAVARQLSAPPIVQAETERAPRIVTDEAGRRVVIPAEVHRIVSLSPDLTETVYALGLEDRLVGDTSYCDTPPAAKTKPHVGGPSNPSLEAIAALRPDLVLASETINWANTADAIARLGIPVYTTNPHTVQGMIDSFGRLADLLGASKQGGALVADLNRRLQDVHGRLADVPPVRALFVVWLEPLITIGQNTFIADALRCAGAESIVRSSQNWPQYNFEEVVRLQPDYIVMAGSHSGEDARTLEDLRSRPAWKDLRAVREGHVAIISEEIDRPAPGLIGVVEQLARQIHPAAFASNDPPSHGDEIARSAQCAR